MIEFLEAILWCGVAVAFLMFLFRKAKSDPFTSQQRQDMRRLTEEWKREPPIGTRFIFCGRACVVVDTKFHGGIGWQQGVHAAYVDNRGRIRYLTMARMTWEGIADGYLLDELKRAPFAP